METFRTHRSSRRNRPDGGRRVSLLAVERYDAAAADWDYAELGCLPPEPATRRVALAVVPSAPSHSRFHRFGLGHHGVPKAS